MLRTPGNKYEVWGSRTNSFSHNMTVKPQFPHHTGAHPTHQTRPAPATLPRNFTLPKDTLRGRISTPTGSPHLGNMHPLLPPSCIIEELHRALATKHRQDRWGRQSIPQSISLHDINFSFLMEYPGPECDWIKRCVTSGVTRLQQKNLPRL